MRPPYLGPGGPGESRTAGDPDRCRVPSRRK